MLVSRALACCYGSVSTRQDEREDEDRGSPVGRRVVLGMLGLGALGVVVGAPVSEALNRVEADDPTGLAQLLPAGGGFRYYSIAGRGEGGATG